MLPPHERTATTEMDVNLSVAFFALFNLDSIILLQHPVLPFPQLTRKVYNLRKHRCYKNESSREPSEEITKLKSRDATLRPRSKRRRVNDDRCAKATRRHASSNLR